MISQRPAFTILEVLIAMSLAVFIMLAIMQIQRGAMRYLERVQVIMDNNRDLSLLFGQLERDLSSAFVLFSSEEAEPDKVGQPAAEALTPKDATKEDKDKKDPKKITLEKIAFVGQCNDQGDALSVNKRRIDAFKSLSFITTNVLQVYEEKRMRALRVVYLLEKDKEHSTRQELVYKLVRKETYDLKNSLAKRDEYEAATKATEVREVTIARRIKAMWLEYGMLAKDVKRDDKKDSTTPATDSLKADKKLQEGPAVIWSNTWGDKEQTQAMVPQRVGVYIDCYDHTHKPIRYQVCIPVFAYPAKKPEKPKPLEPEKPPAQPAAPAGPNAAVGPVEIDKNAMAQALRNLLEAKP